jgi:hypothetical protein
VVGDKGGDRLEKLLADPGSRSAVEQIREGIRKGDSAEDTSAAPYCRGYGADAHLLVTAAVMALPALLAVLDHLARCWIVLAPRTLGRPQRHSIDDSVA